MYRSAIRLELPGVAAIFLVAVPLWFAATTGDPVTRATWVLAASTIALVEATLGLCIVMVWQTGKLVGAQRELETKRRDWEAKVERKRTLDADLNRAFRQDWKPAVREMFRQSRLRELGEVLQIYGTTEDELKSLFPEVFRLP